MTIEKRDVTFKSADNLCAGWFCLPNEQTPMNVYLRLPWRTVLAQ